MNLVFLSSALKIIFVAQYSSFIFVRIKSNQLGLMYHMDRTRTQPIVLSKFRPSNDICESCVFPHVLFNRQLTNINETVRLPDTDHYQA